jgi:hypothetical protein
MSPRGGMGQSDVAFCFMSWASPRYYLQPEWVAPTPQ